MELSKTIKLFKWADKNGIDIVHTVDVPKIKNPTHDIELPGAGLQPQIVMMKMFIGSCPSKEHFQNIFDIEYIESNFAKLPEIMEYNLKYEIAW